MTLKDYYHWMWKQPKVAEKYWKCGSNDYGQLLQFFNTNFRNLYPAFSNAYIELSSEEGRPRSQFQLVASHGQEKAKQYTVRMRQSWLYYVDSTGAYHRSQRGKVFEKVISSSLFNADEKDLLTYLLLLSSDFNFTSNYIFERTREMYNFYEAAGYKTDYIFSAQEELLKRAKSLDMLSLANLDYFYIANLYRPYGEVNFLEEFLNSSPLDKSQLKSYVKQNINAGKPSRCILSKKYEASGNFNAKMLVYATWVFYVTKQLEIKGAVRFDEYVNTILFNFSKFFNINVKKIKDFILDNVNVFAAVYNKIYNVTTQKVMLIDNPVRTPRTITKDDVKKAEETVDPTDTEGQAKQEQASATLKRMARVQSGYRCILEDIEGCQPKYFTSKETGHNYLEVHHFIPREYASDFDTSIEVLENYVALCPCCHRKIHLAADRERKGMITAIYNKRLTDLQKKGIDVPKLKEVLKYYKFDAENI